MFNYSELTPEQLKSLPNNKFINMLECVWRAGHALGRLGIADVPDFSQWGIKP